MSRNGNQASKSPMAHRYAPSSQQEAATPIPLEASNFTCIDGPPSSERIRAYADQLRRGSTSGTHSRTHTLSSFTSSIISRKSNVVPAHGNVSRRASTRSTTSSMSYRDHSDSQTIFGRNLFTRKPRRQNASSLGSSMSFAMAGDMVEDDFVRDQMYRRPASRRQISEPYNFQHVTHTRQEQLPNLNRTSPMELVTEFSAIRASQAPSHGSLRGIRAQDLHLERCSSRGLASPSPKSDRNLHHPLYHRGHSAMSHYAPDLPKPRRLANRSQSHDNLRAFLPPRLGPPPVSPPCPIEPPIRTSSRSAAVYFTGGQTSLPRTTIERPYTHAGIRRPAPFGVPRPLQPSPDLTDQRLIPSETPSHAVTTPGNEAWPLTTCQPTPLYPRDLSQDASIAARRRSRNPSTSPDLKGYRSVPSLSLRGHEYDLEAIGQVTGHDRGRAASKSIDNVAEPPRSPLCRVRWDSWEADIDYCYEHEAEAHCDYNWERRSLDQGRNIELPLPLCFDRSALPCHPAGPQFFPKSDQTPRQTLTPSDLPELSPASVSSAAESDPKTPGQCFNTNIVRRPSTAISFQESFGFSLSATLLIPKDFASQMEQEAAYDNAYVRCSGEQPRATELLNRPPSPNDDTMSSIGSYRSSNYSRGSTRSASTAPSIVTSHLSQDSLVSLGQCCSHVQTSKASQPSLSDLIPSMLRAPEIPPRDASRPKTPTSSRKPSLDLTARKDAPLPPTPPHHRRTKAIMLEPLSRKGANYFAPPRSLGQEEPNLSPVAEDFSEKSREDKIHGRKTSVPIAPVKLEKDLRVRGRSNTMGSDAGKRRASYVLFPQI